ncbi:MAG TPA: hypothetical protein VIX17_08120 [Pyrinomonadaceae bacterium]|jgi:hypothetical protein
MKNYKSKFSLLLLVAISTVLMMSCAKSETTTNRAATSTAPAASPAATTTTAAGQVGVPECDAFLKAYEACVHDKVPAAARPTFDTTLANWKKAWHDQAANPQTKSALAAACKTAHDNARTTMKAYNCTL